jgi:L-alanine-DL-glutamate epimerase-like enolase superfamily enzyme
MALRLEVEERTVRLRTPLPTAWGLLDARTLFLTRLSGDDGIIGRGEAAPLQAYDGVSDAHCRAELATLAGALGALDDDAPGHVVMDALARATDCGPALAAVDMALWDRGGRRLGRPVAEMLAGDPLAAVAVHRTIGGVDPIAAEAAARAAAADGFTAFKVKVGLRQAAGARPGPAPADLAGDLARVAAVRRGGGPGTRIKVDANGAWSVEEATEAIARLVAAPLAVAAVEEPVSGGEDWVQLRAALQGAGIDVELSMDETADREPAAVNRGPDVVELKLARTGGIGTLLVQASLAQLAGVQVAIASTFDGPLGIAAAVHAAAALRLDRPLGLATLEALDLTEHPDLAELAQRLEPSRGTIAVPRGPGLL